MLFQTQNHRDNQSVTIIADVIYIPVSLRIFPGRNHIVQKTNHLIVTKYTPRCKMDREDKRPAHPPNMVLFVS